MSDDERALLAAIVADPADDTLRLAYADCIEERGNASRAEFIRVQVEAERHHVHSPARLKLAGRAETLFGEHWIGWWGEVCAAVGLPLPAPKPVGALGRLARRAGLGAPPGDPYEARGTTVRPRSGRVYDFRLGGWSEARFRRGFPDSVSVGRPSPGADRGFLARWPSASPLSGLRAEGAHPGIWDDGPHLAGVRSLELVNYHTWVVSGVLRSSHLPRLDDLGLAISDCASGEVEDFADELASLVTDPRVRALKRLTIPVWTDRAAEVVAGAENLAGLDTLAVDLTSPDAGDPAGDDDAAGAGRCLAILAGSPHLAGVRELEVYGGVAEHGIAAAVRGPTWRRLRRLRFEIRFGARVRVLPETDDLPELEDFALTGARFDFYLLDALATCGLVRRVRHLSLGLGGDAIAEAWRLADVLAPLPFETLGLTLQGAPPGAAVLFREKLGDRVRVYGG